eukprot:TRINITY_DN2501_c0_g2_i3.p2 TRINITY_DN2501_c0_g2~~TRINITY_DN2501_c0_g2_i3.p2  ORF type:complete len:184 (+),score=30.09 TRINITY_DN2501_c0_g2_i3:53-604(+)
MEALLSYAEELGIGTKQHTNKYLLGDVFEQLEQLHELQCQYMLVVHQVQLLNNYVMHRDLFDPEVLENNEMDVIIITNHLQYITTNTEAILEYLNLPFGENYVNLSLEHQHIAESLFHDISIGVKQGNDLLGVVRNMANFDISDIESKSDEILCFYEKCRRYITSLTDMRESLQKLRALRSSN